VEGISIEAYRQRNEVHKDAALTLIALVKGIMEKYQDAFAMTHCDPVLNFHNKTFIEGPFRSLSQA
jgi:hypothetical protein